MADRRAAGSSGVSFMGLLAIVFITLKLTGYITWSWWWVTAPLWGPFAVIVGILAMVAAVAAIAVLAAGVCGVVAAYINR